MTEDQHKELVEIGNYFYEEFSKLIAKCHNKATIVNEYDLLYYLQDKSSVFGSCYRKYLEK